MTFTKGQAVTFNSLGIQAIAGTYVGPVKASAKLPEGGHRVELYGKPGVRIVVKRAPTAYATIDDALQAVAKGLGVAAKEA